jgi:hypothetical protein
LTWRQTKKKKKKKNRSVQQSASVKNYFDYSAHITQRKKLWLLRFQDRQLRRQLRLVMLGGSSPCTRANYRQHSGARYQLALECGKSPWRPAISSTLATRWSQQRSGARQ